MSSYYFYIDENQQQQGPIDLLKFSSDGTPVINLLPFAADTYVWKEGMADWMHVKEIPELQVVLNPAQYVQNEDILVQPLSNPFVETTQDIEYSKPSKLSFWENTEDLWYALLSFGLAALATWFLFDFFTDGRSGRIKVGVLAAPIIGVYYGFKFLFSFIKRIFS